MGNHKINWGIIGCGDVAEVKSGPAFNKVNDSKLIGIMRRDKDKVMDFAKRHNVSNWYTEASELLDNQNINAVYIATPPSSHLEYAIAALKAGKNVYLEKPMVLNASEAKLLSSAVINRKAKLTVAHYRRALPAFLKVKEILDSSIIGRISSAEIIIKQSKNTDIIAKTDKNWRIDPLISGGGYFHDIAPHQIDLMCYYFGDIIAANSEGLKKDASINDYVSGSIIFKNGLKFKGVWNFDALESEKEDICEIYGEEGTISFSFYGEVVRLELNNGKHEKFTYKNPTHIQQPMISKTVNYFLNGHKNPCSVDEGMLVMEIMDAFCCK